MATESGGLCACGHKESVHSADGHCNRPGCPCEDFIDIRPTTRHQGEDDG